MAISARGCKALCSGYLRGITEENHEIYRAEKDLSEPENSDKPLAWTWRVQCNWEGNRETKKAEDKGVLRLNTERQTNNRNGFAIHKIIDGMF